MKFKTEIKWAVICTVTTIAWNVLGKLTGLHAQRIAYYAVFNSMILVPSIIIYLVSMIEKRRTSFGNVMTYKEALRSGLMLSLFITILGPLNPLSLGLMSPDFFQNSIDYVVSTNMMTPGEAASQFNMASFIIQGLIAGPVFGLVLSLILAAIVRKGPRNSATPVYSN